MYKNKLQESRKFSPSDFWFYAICDVLNIILLLLDGCRLKSNCPLVGPETIGGMTSVGVFLRDPNPYFREFFRKPWRNLVRSTSAIGNRTRHLPSNNFERRAVSPLVGLLLLENVCV